MKAILLVPRILSSRLLTVVLMGLAAVSMAAITVREAVERTGEVPFPVYHSWWFTAILVLVWLNLFANASRRSWWSRKKIPGILAHLGFLLILTGGFVTWTLGVRGDLPISEGETRDSFDVDFPVLEVTAATERGDRNEALPLTARGEFAPRGIFQVLKPFFPRRTATLENGVPVTILDAVPSSRFHRHVGEDPSGEGPAAVTLALDPPLLSSPFTLMDGESASPRGNTLARITYRDAGEANPAALARGAFLESIEIEPPGGEPVSFPIRTPGDVGKEVSKGGYTVKILEYHPDFKVGREPSPGDKPLNPALKLHVEGPCGERDLYSFALVEFHGNRFPDGTAVLYHRPAAGRSLLLVSSKGRVEAWLGPDEGPRPLAAGKPLEVGGDSGEGLAVKLISFLPSARRVERIVPDPGGGGPPAFQVRIGEEGAPAWISSKGGRAVSADEKIFATVGRTMPLGFALTLDDAVAEFWPASSIPKAYYSLVTLEKPGTPGSEAARIETNDPLHLNGFRIYQSGMDQEAPYRYSFFAVNKDPGLSLVTAGFLVMAAGLAWLYLVRFVLRPLKGKKTASGRSGS